ncbi:MAG: type II secretion system F family protein, partial [Pseudomonadales bacterium]
MHEYEYEVADRNGQLLRGRLQADSARDVVRQLSEDGQTVIEVTEHHASLEGGLHRRLKAQDLMMGFHELTILLESGVALGDAVLAQSRGSYHPRLNLAFTSISKDLMRGENLLT